MSPRRERRGFTLIELLVVLAVLAILAGLVGPLVFRNVGAARMDAARAQIELFGLALDAYRLDNGSYPTTEQGLAALWTLPTATPLPPRWRGPYLRKSVPADPWGHAYMYRAPGTESPIGYDLASYGGDGAPGGEDDAADVTSWSTGS